MHTSIPTVQQALGSDHDGLLRRQMELPTLEVHDIPTHRHSSTGVRLHESTCEQTPQGYFVDVSTSPHKTTTQAVQGDQGPQPTLHPDTPNLGKGVYSASSTNGVGHPSASANQSKSAYATQGVPNAPSGPTVKFEDFQISNWRTFARERQLSRGVAEDLADRPEVCYKKSVSTTIRGRHLDSPWSAFLCYLMQERGGRPPFTVSDVDFCNFVSKVCTSEGGARTALSAIRVIFKKAYGSSLPLLRYEKDLGDQAVAKAREIKARAPKYHTALDLGKGGGKESVFSILIEKRQLAEQGIRPEINARDGSLFIGRLVTQCRSDCFSKWDPRNKLYLRCYDSAGNMIDTGVLSRDILGTIPDGSMEHNFREPKDPRRIGLYSDTVTTRPIRFDVVLQHIDQPWTATCEGMAALCWHRQLYFYIKMLEDKCRIGLFEPGKFWPSPTHLDSVGRPLCLKPTSLSSLVSKILGESGYKVAQNENPGCSESSEQLAGHVLRGHAGSLAYDLGNIFMEHKPTITSHPAFLRGQVELCWNPDEGIKRARHTLHSFLQSYHRATAPRIITAFKLLLQKCIYLRLEEALLL